MSLPKGETREIAPFDSRAKALKALMSTSQALEHAQNLSKVAANDSGKTVTAGKNKSGAMAGLIGVVILVGILFMLTQIGPQKGASFSGGSAATSSAGPEGSASGAPGVPMSADDFLRQQ